MRSLGRGRDAIHQRLRPFSVAKLATIVQQQQTRFIGVFARPLQSAQTGAQRLPVLQGEFNFALKIGFDT